MKPSYEELADALRQAQPKLQHDWGCGVMIVQRHLAALAAGKPIARGEKFDRRRAAIDADIAAQQANMPACTCHVAKFNDIIQRLGA